MDRLLRVKPVILSDKEGEVEDVEGRPEEDDDLELLTPDGDVDPRGKIGKQLLKLGKVQYRHTNALPPWFMERRDEVLDKRTPSQIRRTLKDWMIGPDKGVVDTYKKTPLGWRQNVKENTKIAETIVYGPIEAITYCSYHMSSRFVILRRIFYELSLVMPSFKPNRILDFGCGPGTVASAAVDVWGKEVEKYHGLDISKGMLDAASIMTRGIGPDCTYWERTMDIIKRMEKTGERFDIAVCAHTLTELTSDPARLIATQLLFDSLDIGGLLVIVDRGNTIGSHAVRTARKVLLDKFNGVEESDGTGRVLSFFIDPPVGVKGTDIAATVVAPCTHDKECPLGQGLFCSFSQKVYSTMIRKASQEKYSYVVIQKKMKSSRNSKKLSAKFKNGESNEWTGEDASLSADIGGSEDTESNKSHDSIDNPSPLSVIQRLLDHNRKDINSLVDDLIHEVKQCFPLTICMTFDLPLFLCTNSPPK